MAQEMPMYHVVFSIEQTERYKKLNPDADKKVLAHMVLVFIMPGTNI